MKRRKHFTKKQRKACRSRGSRRNPAAQPATAVLGHLKRPNHAQRRIDRAIYLQSDGDTKLQALKKARNQRLKKVRREINKTKREARKEQRRLLSV